MPVLFCVLCIYDNPTYEVANKLICIILYLGDDDGDDDRDDNPCDHQERNEDNERRVVRQRLIASAFDT